MDRTSNSGFEPFFWPLLYKSQSWFLALDLWTEPQILVLHLSFGLYSTSPRAFWDRTSNSGFEPFLWPLLYKPQSWFLAGWIYGQNLKFWF